MEELILKIGIACVIAAIVYFVYKKHKTNGVAKPTTGMFTTDLTQEARKGTLDRIIGRDGEVERTIHILLRRKKNNPLLLGQPGVGKTAIVEGLAQKIVAGNVPNALKNKTILALDLNQLMAGTQYRGELESRLQSVLSNLQKKNSNVILF